MVIPQDIPNYPKCISNFEFIDSLRSESYLLWTNMLAAIPIIGATDAITMYLDAIEESMSDYEVVVESELRRYHDGEHRAVEHSAVEHSGIKHRVEVLQVIYEGVVIFSDSYIDDKYISEFDDIKSEEADIEISEPHFTQEQHESEPEYEPESEPESEPEFEPEIGGIIIYNDQPGSGIIIQYQSHIKEIEDFIKITTFNYLLDENGKFIFDAQDDVSDDYVDCA